MRKLFILMIFFASAQTKRISEEKCQEYKDIIKETACLDLSDFRDHGNCSRKAEYYNCRFICCCGVVGGEEADPGVFPHMAALGWEDANGNIAFHCGGSLISERFVLTAAHCGWNSGFESSPKWVRLGVQDFSIRRSKDLLQQLKIKNFIKHPEYDSANHLNDIALIELEKNVGFYWNHLRPACLQQEEFHGDEVTATGWGEFDPYDQKTDTLMKVRLPVVDMNKCKPEFEDFSLNEERQICAGGVRGQDTCRGDSGSPIQKAHADAPCVHDIVGITTFGHFICGHGHAVYTKTSYYLDWIEGIVWPQPEEKKAERVLNSPGGCCEVDLTKVIMHEI